MARSLKKSPKLSFKSRVRSPSLRCKPTSDSIERDQRIEFLGGGGGVDAGNGRHDDDDHESSFTSSNEEGGEIHEGNNKVAVVVDKELASMAALEWALSHALQSQDTVFLLYVAKPSRKGKKMDGKHSLRANQLLHQMKVVCQTKRPGVQVEIRIVEGKEKGPIVVQEAKQLEVSLLVLGQEKKPLVWRLFRRWTCKRRRCSVVDYCVQNASCMTIAVRRKSSKIGGYLITTKRHKNFWLLA